MNQDTALWVTMWVASGAFIGGVVTPVIGEKKGLSGWLLAAAGLVVGAIGSIVLLLPAWVVLSVMPDHRDERLPWQRDALSVEEARRWLAEPEPINPVRDLKIVGNTLKANFWPAPRAHSHRRDYVAVFFALAIITFVEVALSVWDDAPFSVAGPLAALSITKVILVVMFFMHLRYDSRWYAWIFAFSLPFAGIVLAVLAVS